MKNSFYSPIPENQLGWKHLGLVAFCAFCLVGILFLKNGKIIFTKSFYTQPAVLTYDKAREKVLAQLEKEGWSNSSFASNSGANPLAQSESLGRVLGLTSQENTLVEPLENLFSPSQLDSIQIKTTNDNSKERIKKYFDELAINESVGGELSTLLSFSKADASGYEESIKSSSQMVSYLKGMEVPSDISDFHKFKLIYYMSLNFLSKSMLNNSSEDPSMQKYATIFFSVIDKINSEKERITIKYDIQ